MPVRYRVPVDRIGQRVSGPTSRGYLLNRRRLHCRPAAFGLYYRALRVRSRLLRFPVDDVMCRPCRRRSVLDRRRLFGGHQTNRRMQRNISRLPVRILVLSSSGRRQLSTVEYRYRALRLRCRLYRCRWRQLAVRRRHVSVRARVPALCERKSLCQDGDRQFVHHRRTVQCGNSWKQVRPIDMSVSACNDLPDDRRQRLFIG